MAFLFAQMMTGLASAASLFLVASGLSIIFGVTRIVNFAHGALYMAGAYFAYSLTTRFAGVVGFWAGLGAAAVIVVALATPFEMLVLRRIYRAPELFQLLATFGAALVIEDLVVLGWGTGGSRRPARAGHGRRRHRLRSGPADIRSVPDRPRPAGARAAVAGHPPDPLGACSCAPPRRIGKWWPGWA